jgi:hypothetical protein
VNNINLGEPAIPKRIFQFIAVCFWEILVNFSGENMMYEQKRKSSVDPRRDPRTEKMGRKQRRKAYLRVMEFFGKSV